MSVFPSLRLPDETAKALDEFANATERPKTYLAEYADYQVALDRLRDKDDPVILSAELRKRLARKN